MQKGEVAFSEMTENGRISIVAEGAKPASFVQLSHPEYGKDAAHVYFRAQVIHSAHPDTFVFLGHLYSRDQFRVFWRERVIPRADPDSFVVLDGPELWSRDSREVYYADAPLGVRLPNDFRVISDSWASDGVAYYYIRQFVPKGILNSDFQSTRLLNSAYATDKDRAYFGTRPIEGSDPESFRPLSEWYAVDKKRAYFEDQPIDGADVETFRQEGHYHTAKDQYRTYVFGKVREAQPPAQPTRPTGG